MVGDSRYLNGKNSSNRYRWKTRRDFIVWRSPTWRFTGIVQKYVQHDLGTIKYSPKGEFFTVEN